MSKIFDLVEYEMSKTKDLILSYPWENKKAYAFWLAQTYYMVSHSTRLVALAGACVKVGKEDFHARFVDHSKEERGHQLICLSDIKALGFELADFPVLFQSSCMYQVQYYWIQHRSPVSFLGYTLSLECLAEKFGFQVASKVVDSHTKKAAKFLLLHSEADQEHTESAYDLVKKLTQEEELEVAENLKISCDLYRSMLVEAQVQLNTMKKAG